MTDIFTQDVSAWVEGGPTNFRVEEVEVTRHTGREIGKATIKGVPENVDDVYPAPGADFEVFVATESSTDPWRDDLSSSRRIFYGEAISAKQNEEGSVIFEVAGQKDQLFKERVKLEVENPTYTRRVLVDLLEETFGTVHSDLDSATPYQPYVAPASDFTGNYQRPWRFGNAERGLPLIDAIEDLLNSLGAVMWADRNGIIRFEPYPEHNVWDTPLVTEINSGESSRNTSRVIFEASGAASEGGQGASYIHSQTSYNSASQIQDEDGPDAPSLTLSDVNVSSQEEADQQAYESSVSEDQNRSLGSVTIIGNGDIDVYDHIIVPELEYNEDGVRPLPNDYQAGRYKVDTITHKINPSDGFLTTMKLTPPFDESLARCTVASGAGFPQDRLGQYNNSVQEGRVSATSNGDGGLIAQLFGDDDD